MTDVVAILCADLHLSEKAPLARRGEPDWFAAMERPLREIRQFQDKHGCAVFCSGDIFDKPCPSPHLINFALDVLPQMYAVPGQHDLPHHDYGRIMESAYGTLMKTEVVLNVTSPEIVGEITVSGVPWGQPVPEGFDRDIRCLQVCLVHAYCWIDKCGYLGADISSHAKSHAKRFPDYDVLAFGDNHIPFQGKVKGKFVYNNGSLMRRTIDQKDYRPSVGLLKRDGTIKRHYLDISADVFEERAESLVEDFADNAKIKDFLQELRGLEVESLDFMDAIKNYARSEDRPEMRELLLGLVECL